MKFLQIILFPFALLYGGITALRNFMYDKGFIKSYSFDIPIIAVGNLSVGGTGKTPQIEYLIRLLSPNYKVAILSRGYKRKTKGFVLADSQATVETLGDEPFQIYQKFPNIQVAVDAKRKNGITQLLQWDDKPEVVLLDDAYQHRKVKAGFYILLSAFNDLFCDDVMLPSGTLREGRNGAQRADVIIITKCPKDLSELAQEEIKKKIGLNKPIFFSFIDYDDKIYNTQTSKQVEDIRVVDKLLVAGIAKPEPFFAYLQAEQNTVLIYPDHHHFSEEDCNKIRNKAKNKLIITTEKDYVRLKKYDLKSLFYLPIQSKFISKGTDFNRIIEQYVGTSTRDR
ncbi:tetraacyldisaccharide 4'-kinase [Flavobacterium aciduliphilum]|uniref:Tetraacyldisaccharide 4'-kinase n=1 Tax=Flavobacterium aciduliphilum TaxID=1101402 RepID=A0A328YFT8_9FLAO|nr:tetraacyldisaccharide 4'-kinase [Flavobacterium aciduliphilum]RAR70832.1 lipid-A-disaccharide kinase [Flavobacterium aciduliphilum]